MAAFHPKYGVEISISPKYARYWEQHGFIIIPSIRVTNSNTEN